jgi:hypothetical protein
MEEEAKSGSPWVPPEGATADENGRERTGRASSGERESDDRWHPPETDEQYSERASDGEAASNERQLESEGDEDRSEQKITAPSLGPNTVIEREPVEERLARHEQSEVDAMGKDKRRPVVGQSYGPSKARQFALYGVFLLIVGALAVGGYFLIQTQDKGVGKDVPNSAPWSKPGAKQIPPKPIQ